MRETKPNFLDWLGISTQPDFSRGRWFGACVGVLAFLILLAVLATGMLVLARLFLASLGIPLLVGDDSSESVRNFGLLLTTLFAAPFLVWRSIIAHKQALVAEQGHITDRVNQAVDGLGATRTMRRQRLRASGRLAYERDENGEPDFSKPIFEEITEPNLEVRIGSIFALVRIAEDSLRDHVQVMEILCTYIRENSRSRSHGASADALVDTSDDEPDFNSSLRADLQTALSVIARRSPERVKYEASLRPPYQLDLSNSVLNGAVVFDGRFGPVKLDRVTARNASLRFCDFRGARFYQCDFENADLEFSTLINASVAGSIFRDAELSNCDFSQSEGAHGGISGGSFIRARLDDTKWIGAWVGSDFSQASFMGTDFAGVIVGQRANFTGAYLFETDFSRAKIFDQNVLDKTVGISNGEGKTLIPEGFTYPSHWVDIEEIRTDFETRTGEKLGVVETYEALLKEWREEHA